MRRDTAILLAVAVLACVGLFVAGAAMQIRETEGEARRLEAELAGRDEAIAAMATDLRAMDAWIREVRRSAAEQSVRAADVVAAYAAVAAGLRDRLVACERDRARFRRSAPGDGRGGLADGWRVWYRRAAG